jgi:hypothetical protein
MTEDIFLKDKNSLQDIVELDISNKNINEIPSQIEKFSKLTLLIADCNNIENLPSELFKLKSLSMLSLSNNQISVLPNKIEDINIFYLDISNNPIKTLPEIIYKKKRISNLFLHNTSIEFISEDICQLKNLITLTFDDKHLPTIVKYLSSFPNIDSINLTHSTHDETSLLIQNLGLRIVSENWLSKEQKKDTGVVKIFEKSTFTVEDDMEGMVEYGLSVVKNEPEEGLRMYHEAMDLYEENDRRYPLPVEIIDLSIEIVLNTAKKDIQKAINLLDIVEVEEFRVEAIDKLLVMTDDEYYKVVLKGMRKELMTGKIIV